LSYYPGTKQKYPVIIFLHGIGEGDGFGEGDLKNLKVGIGPAIAKKAEKFEFIVIFPQSGGTWSPDSDYTQDMLTALAQTERDYPVDTDRVALTGLSTGGAGVWAIGARYNDRFSALVPMASNGSHQEDAARLTHMPVRAYCSVFGDMFAGWNDVGMVNKIKELNPSADVKFTSTMTLGHDCWEDVYKGDELYQWLAKQRRASAAAAPSASASPPPISAPVIQASVVPAPPPTAAPAAPSRVSTPAPSRPAIVSTPAVRTSAPPAAPSMPAPSAPVYAPNAYIPPPAPQPVQVNPSQPARTSSPPPINTPW
ncbi:MAG TPA: hypothetical protein VHM90_19835, partial [Phycisphaerae bacterium]|nr:hypothetical protein [Phycisphaerae bacterium]